MISNKDQKDNLRLTAFGWVIFISGLLFGVTICAVVVHFGIKHQDAQKGLLDSHVVESLVDEPYSKEVSTRGE
jgi:hypothetical protein